MAAAWCPVTARTHTAAHASPPAPLLLRGRRPTTTRFAATVPRRHPAPTATSLPQPPHLPTLRSKPQRHVVSASSTDIPGPAPGEALATPVPGFNNSSADGLLHASPDCGGTVGSAADKCEGVVRVGGQTFISRTQLSSHFGHLLHSSHLEVPLDEFDARAVIDLITLGHPAGEEKLAAGVKRVVVSMHPAHATNCFFLVRPDGTREDFSYRKCVNGLVKRFSLHDDHPARERTPRVGTLVLQKLIYQGPTGEARAWELFDEMLERGEANEYHATVLLKNCSSVKQRQHLARIQARGIVPTVVTYTTLMARLMLECRVDEARAVLADMLALDIEADLKTHQVMNDDDLDRKRLRELIRLQKYGMEGQKEARAIFERMCATGEVNSQHFNVMMQACLDSGMQKELLRRFDTVDESVQPDLITYALHISQMMLEGDLQAAVDLVRARCAAYPAVVERLAEAAPSGGTPNNTLYALQRLLTEGVGDLEDAWDFWEEMVTYGDASTVDCGVILQACGSLDALERLSASLDDGVLHDITEMDPWFDLFAALEKAAGLDEAVNA